MTNLNKYTLTMGINPASNRFTMLIILLVFISLTIAGCKTPPDPIKMFDMNTITTIKYNVNTSIADLDLNSEVIELNKSNAKDTSNYMILKHIIESYEIEIFELAKSKQDFNNSINLSHSDFELLIHTFGSGEIISTYTLTISIKDKEAILSNNDHMIKLEEETLNQLLTSDLIQVQTVDTPPNILINIDGNNISPSINGQWNYFIYTNRYLTEDIEVKELETPLELMGTTSNQASLTFDSLPSTVTINTYINNPLGKLINSEIYQPTTGNLSFNLPVENGIHYIEIVAKWDSISDASYGQITYGLSLDIESQESFSLSSSTYQPGDLVVVTGNYIDDDLNYTIESTLYNQGLKFQQNGSDYYILLPIMSKAELGSYTLSITDNDHLDETTILTFDVVYKEFDIQYLETSGSTASLQSNDNYAQLNEAFERGRSNLKQEKLWDGLFIQPVGGRISTEYGQIRYTNGSETSSRHSGIDFANPNGTVIVSTQNGYVTLAEDLNITGNTLFIDHGFGIISQYYHTNTIYVSVGDYVEAGEPVAEVGSTGFSTGPHLHFAIYNNGIYLNPWKFFESVPF